MQQRSQVSDRPRNIGADFCAKFSGQSGSSASACSPLQSLRKSRQSRGRDALPNGLRRLYRASADQSLQLHHTRLQGIFELCML